MAEFVGDAAEADVKNIFAHQRAEALIRNYKLTPATLGQKVSRGVWIPKPFLLYASMKVAQTIARGNGRLIISWPPRHGKSQLITKYTPLWCLENFPDKEIVITSYGSDLSTDFGREIRDTIADSADLLNARLRKDSKGVAKFITEQGGSVTSVGVGGALTGRGADVLLLDDYIKTLKEAESLTYRDYVWNWWRTTAMTRLEPGGTAIVVATRWHRDDLIGRLLREQAGRWDHIVIPAIAGADDLFGREPGEALFPERFPIERLMSTKEELGSFYFNALYQQDPMADEDRKTDRKWLKPVDRVPYPERCYWARVWDFAGTRGGGDYTVGNLVAYNPQTGEFYIANIIRRQYRAGETEGLVRDIAVDGDGTGTQIVIEQEPGASGKQIVEHYMFNVLPDFRVKGVPTVTSKYVRGAPFLAAAEAGKVYYVTGSWNETFLAEFDEGFDGANDDQMDTCAIGFNVLTGGRKASPVWGRDMAPHVVHNQAPVNGIVWGR